MRQHSRKSEEFTWRGIDLMAGAVGEWTPANDNPHATQKRTGRGKVIRNIQDGSSGTISYPCDTTSQTYRDLRALYDQDRVNENVVGLGLHKNSAAGVTVFYKNMHILDIPPRPGGGEEPSQVTITFGYEEYDEKYTATTVPVVGS